MQENNRPKWLLPVGIGCLVLLCLCVLLAGAFYFLGDRLAEGLGGFDIPGMTGEIEDFIETGELPLPTLDVAVEPESTDELPTEQPVEPTQSDPGPLSPQKSDQTAFFDNFSSDALDWPVIDGEITVLKYENQAYSMEIREPDYLDGVYIPTLFFPTTVRFDAWGPPGEQGGTIGVECRIQEQDDVLTDYYFVDIDLYHRDAYVAVVADEQEHKILPDDEYLPLSNITANPDEVNTFEVSCLPDKVTISVNGVLEHEVEIPNEYIVTSPGSMTFFMFTYENTMAGYKVFFDNVYAWP
ncbi:MAG: hypothetical protein JW757_11295 [Anaerolineales bacterium]|nr:hypothetical protein [Anaerolineales bacterium]